jgi:hypothetical protein
MVTYHQDGSYEADDWTVGPEEMPRESLLGVTAQSHFKGTGPGGNDDWSLWEAFTYMKAPNEFLDEMLEEVNEIEEDNVTSVNMVVRAYSDESETMWNQDSIDLTDDFMKVLSGEEDDDDGGSIPAPGLSLIIMVIGMVSLSFIFTRRRRS